MKMKKDTQEEGSFGLGKTKGFTGLTLLLKEMKLKKHFLFICTSSIDRSPAAEALFDNSEDIEARSAGVGPFTENPITKEMIEWADYIFCMEYEHKNILLKKFPEAEDKEIVVLNISNDFCRYDDELERLLRVVLDKFGFL